MAHAIGRMAGRVPRVSVEIPLFLTNEDDAALSFRPVVDAFALLSDDYVVMHGVPIAEGGFPPRSRWLDHVVVGPTGVFVLTVRGRIDRDVVLPGGKESTSQDLRVLEESARLLKTKLKTWSGGRRAPLEAHAVLVYADIGPYADIVREAWPHVVPVELVLPALMSPAEIIGKPEALLDPDTVVAIARALFAQYPSSEQDLFREEMERTARVLRQARDRACEPGTTGA